MELALNEYMGQEGKFNFTLQMTSSCEQDGKWP